MAALIHKGHTVHTQADLPEKGSPAPSLRLTKTDLSDIFLHDLIGHKVVLNVFPSIDTTTCAASVRQFNQLASSMSNTLVLCVSKDLPYAYRRFCGAEGIVNVIPASQYKDQSFSQAFGIDLLDGTLAGLMSRAVIILDEGGTIRYTEQVHDISHEPDYEAALSALRAL
jgi:thioredoxin-dependent peroxiredoxin